MHFFCVALFVLIYPGPHVDTYATVQPGQCPTREQQVDLAQSLREATEAAHVQFLFQPLTVQTEPDTDI